MNMPTRTNIGRSIGKNLPVKPLRASATTTTMLLKRGSSVAWSANLERKASREVKRNKKQAKREHERVSKLSEAEREHEVETRKLIEQVRQKQLREGGQEEEFEGFD